VLYIPVSPHLPGADRLVLIDQFAGKAVSCEEDAEKQTSVLPSYRLFQTDTPVISLKISIQQR